jgi:hypothetical protein
LYEEDFNGERVVARYLNIIGTTRETDVVQIVNDKYGADDMSDVMNGSAIRTGACLNWNEIIELALYDIMLATLRDGTEVNPHAA